LAPVCNSSRLGSLEIFFGLKVCSSVNFTFLDSLKALALAIARARFLAQSLAARELRVPREDIFWQLTCDLSNYTTTNTKRIDWLAAVGKRWLFGSCEQVKQKVKGLGGVVFQNRRQCVVSASE
jgi:hypothetical protein